MNTETLSYILQFLIKYLLMISHQHVVAITAIGPGPGIFVYTLPNPTLLA